MAAVNQLATLMSLAWSESAAKVMHSNAAPMKDTQKAANIIFDRCIAPHEFPHLPTFSHDIGPKYLLSLSLLS